MKKTVELTWEQKCKNFIWHRIYPFFPWWQKYLVKLGIVWNKDTRQKYHIGWVAPDVTLSELKKHLHTQWNFGNHFVAWVDDGQVLSWRKLESFDHQYHLRVFCDGEIRGHYEYTPESKPIKHFKEIGEEDRTEVFRKFLGEFAVQEKHISHLEPDLNTAPESEITIEAGLSLGK